jgi:hypothetical protein
MKQKQPEKEKKKKEGGFWDSLFMLGELIDKVFSLFRWFD